ncbi:hypothetical protein LTR92_011610 [Exophiala xenobiotica]|nr:hypothetical protein LTR92_011610 [Exophiala xenobiotica]
MALCWIFRCLPGLSVLALLILTECALQVLQTIACISLNYSPGLASGHHPVFAQILFMSYSLLLHLLALIFPIRLSRSVWHAWGAVEKVYGPGGTSVVAPKDKNEDSYVPQHNRRATQEQNRIDRLGPIHAIMIPIYKEDIALLEDTLKVLASHALATTAYDIFLAMEERDPNAVPVAMKLETSFRHRFKDIQHTIHPADLPGEVPGKSSNISWVAKGVQRKYTHSQYWRDVLMTVMDSDTHLLDDYFQIILRRHAYYRQRGETIDMTMYMPPIIFDRNAHLVPILVRIADLMWCGAGLSCFQDKPGRHGIAFPTAVYTLPLPLVHLVAGWDTDAGAIGEDMHMMLKCFFATNGRMAIESVPSPASQCNISSTKSGIRGWVDSHRGRYVQGLRHMWGCLDAGYTADHFFKLGSNAPPSPGLGELSHNSKLELKLSHYQMHGDQGYVLSWRNVVLVTRVFEAHFLPTHLFLVTIFSTIFTRLPASLVRSEFLTVFLDFTAYLRAMGFCLMLIYFFVFYEGYHHVCVEAREAEMKEAGLYEEMEENFSKRNKTGIRIWLDYLVFPIAGIVFGSTPLMHAAFAHFWSDRLDYKVSTKPIRLTKRLALEFTGQEV